MTQKYLLDPLNDYTTRILFFNLKKGLVGRQTKAKKMNEKLSIESKKKGITIFNQT